MDFTAQDIDYAERVKGSFDRQPFMKYIGAELFAVRPGYCEIHVGYKKELTQQHGYFHAGVIGTLADNAAGYAAYTLMSADSSVLTVEYKLNLMSPGEGEKLIARSEVLKYGKTLTICRSDIYVIKSGPNGYREEKICAVAQVTLIELKNQQDG
jgi:uncharacterized protein (TIGR00369 family)